MLKLISKLFLLAAIAAGAFPKEANPILAQASAAFPFIRVFAFAYWFGTAIHTTFILGPIIFKTLTRHTFAQVQNKLFPWFFDGHLLCISLIALVHISDLTRPGRGVESGKAFLSLLGTIISPAADPTFAFAFGGILASMFAVVIQVLFLEPLASGLIRRMHKLEKEHLGLGHEVGVMTRKLTPPANAGGKIVAQWRGMAKKFGMMHGISALLNIISIASAVAYGVLLARSCTIHA